MLSCLVERPALIIIILIMTPRLIRLILYSAMTPEPDTCFTCRENKESWALVFTVVTWRDRFPIVSRLCLRRDRVFIVFIAVSLAIRPGLSCSFSPPLCSLYTEMSTSLYSNPLQTNGNTKLPTCSASTCLGSMRAPTCRLSQMEWPSLRSGGKNEMARR